MASPSRDLEQIFEAHHSVVFGAAYRVTGSAQDAEDVLQTIFLRLLRRRKTIDLSPSPKSYLYRAGVNAALDLLRTRTRSRSLPLDDLDASLEESSLLNPDRRQEDRELRKQLRQAILCLSERSAEIFCLRFLEGFGNREIANMLGMSQTAVGVALHRARNQVKKELGSLVGGQ
jgi:RNA polymerase sigma-70 factor (ECF subfamily)